MAAPAGQLRCRACGKALPDHGVLAQHLRDAHGGRNSPGPHAAPGARGAAASGGVGAAAAPVRGKPSNGLSLADLLDAALQKRTAVGQAVEARRLQRRERPAPREAATYKKGIQGTIRVHTRPEFNTITQVCVHVTRRVPRTSSAVACDGALPVARLLRLTLRCLASERRQGPALSLWLLQSDAVPL